MRADPPREEDAFEFVAAMRRSRELHRPWVYPPNTAEAYRVWLERQATAEFEGSLIRRLADDELVGFCNLSQIVRGAFQSAFMGFAAVRGSDRRGYMREGIDLVLGEAFGRLGLNRVEANVQPANEASKILVARLGFQREGFSERYLKVGGRWRDHERWAIRAEPWRRARR